MAAGLLWLAMTFPAVCDAILDKLEYDAMDDPASQEPEPFCAECGADVAPPPDNRTSRLPADHPITGRQASSLVNYHFPRKHPEDV